MPLNFLAHYIPAGTARRKIQTGEPSTSTDGREEKLIYEEIAESDSWMEDLITVVHGTTLRSDNKHGSKMLTRNPWLK